MAQFTPLANSGSKYDMTYYLKGALAGGVERARRDFFPVAARLVGAHRRRPGEVANGRRDFKGGFVGDAVVVPQAFEIARRFAKRLASRSRGREEVLDLYE